MSNSGWMLLLTPPIALWEPNRWPIDDGPTGCMNRVCLGAAVRRAQFTPHLHHVDWSSTVAETAYYKWCTPLDFHKHCTQIQDVSRVYCRTQTVLCPRINQACICSVMCTPVAVNCLGHNSPDIFSKASTFSLTCSRRLNLDIFFGSGLSWLAVEVSGLSFTSLADILLSALFSLIDCSLDRAVMAAARRVRLWGRREKLKSKPTS